MVQHVLEGGDGVFKGNDLQSDIRVLDAAMVEKQIPVTFYYGDYIGQEFTDVPAAGMWAMMSSSADAFTEAYTAAGGHSLK